MIMLREMAQVRQTDPAVQRRWFRDDYFDIFTWQSRDKLDGPDCGYVGFQLCYDLPGYERVLSWRLGKGYSHHRVDGGEASPIKNRTPIMVLDGLLPLPTVLDAFDLRAVTLESRLRAFLRQHLLNYGAVYPGEIDKASPKV